MFVGHVTTGWRSRTFKLLAARDGHVRHSPPLSDATQDVTFVIRLTALPPSPQQRPPPSPAAWFTCTESRDCSLTLSVARRLGLPRWLTGIDRHEVGDVEDVEDVEPVASWRVDRSAGHWVL